MAEPAIIIQLRRLRPIEIVLIRRYTNEILVDGLPAFDQVAEDLDKQLEELPQVDLPFAREVFGTFAMSPFPIDRLNLGLMLGPLTLVDHDTGFALWHQLVRDQHPVVRRDVYLTVHERLMDDNLGPEAGLAEEGLTLQDAHQLRDAFIGAQYLDGAHTIGKTPIAESLEDATQSFEGMARLD